MNLFCEKTTYCHVSLSALKSRMKNRECSSRYPDVIIYMSCISAIGLTIAFGIAACRKREWLAGRIRVWKGGLPTFPRLDVPAIMEKMKTSVRKSENFYDDINEKDMIHNLGVWKRKISDFQLNVYHKYILMYQRTDYHRVQYCSHFGKEYLYWGHWFWWLFYIINTDGSYFELSLFKVVQNVT